MAVLLMSFLSRVTVCPRALKAPVVKLNMQEAARPCELDVVINDSNNVAKFSVSRCSTNYNNVD